jgi:hypothetical protein
MKTYFSIGTSFDTWSLGPMFNSSIDEEGANMEMLTFYTRRGIEYWLIAKRDID